MNDHTTRSIPDIIAHRGASHLAPENTLAAVTLAWELDADMVEVDIRMTLDGRIVIIHDDATGRTTGMNFNVKDSTSNTLRELNAGRVKHHDFRDERIPFLEEVMESVPDGKRLFIEIKCGPEIHRPLLSCIERSGKRPRMVVLCFDAATLAGFKVLAPDIPVYILAASRYNSFSGKPVPFGDDLIESAKHHSFDGLNLLHKGITAEFARSIKAAGLKLYTWTVNDPADAVRLANLGVDGITTDKPDIIRQALTFQP